MKFVILSVLALVAPTVLLAQTATSTSATPATTATTTTTKAATPIAKKHVLKKRAPIARSAAKAVEESTPIDDEPNLQLSDLDLEVAKHVYIGHIPCELGAAVTITPNEKRPGFFRVQTKGATFYMHPVESRTGAIRLEDAHAGAMWLQLGNKSMLMSQKMGQRLADECMSPAQVTFADDMKLHPRPSILDAPIPAAGPVVAQPVGIVK